MFTKPQIRPFNHQASPYGVSDAAGLKEAERP
jgi:hypothetical protein